MYISNKRIKEPEDFLEKLIDETWSRKISWDKIDNEFGKRYVAIVNIPKTKKYFRLEFFDNGMFSFLKVQINLSTKDKIEFQKIQGSDHIERILRLLLAIENKNIVIS